MIFTLDCMVVSRWDLVVEHGKGPSVASGERVPVLVEAGRPGRGLGRHGQGVDACEDLGE
jgi:hypothetical protein